jgi:hypothetical protein
MISEEQSVPLLRLGTPWRCVVSQVREIMRSILESLSCKYVQATIRRRCSFPHLKVRHVEVYDIQHFPHVAYYPSLHGGYARTHVSSRPARACGECRWNLQDFWSVEIDAQVQV